MRFLVDECVGPKVARWLREQGHEVFSVYDEARGISDTEILRKAYSEKWIIITNDKDFGEKVYREQYPHWGVILLRLTDERATMKITVLSRFLKQYADEVPGRFVVVTEHTVRFGR